MRRSSDPAWRLSSLSLISRSLADLSCRINGRALGDVNSKHIPSPGAGKTAAGIEVPAEVVTALGQGKKPPVRVTIKGYTYRSTVATVGGRFMVGVSNEVRASAGVAV